MRLRAIALLTLALALAAPAGAAMRSESGDRAEIHKLLVDYGATLDRRDFDGFGRLFARDGTYGPGGAGDAKGGPVIAERMRKVFASNALGFRAPNFHIFFNEVVILDDTSHAHATSMSLYMVPDADNRPSPALMAAYDDRLVREDGAWKFASRAVKSLMPAPPKP
jgi:hypothetical protein